MIATKCRLMASNYLAGWGGHQLFFIAMFLLPQQINRKRYDRRTFHALLCTNLIQLLYRPRTECQPNPDAFFHGNHLQHKDSTTTTQSQQQHNANRPLRVTCHMSPLGGVVVPPQFFAAPGGPAGDGNRPLVASALCHCSALRGPPVLQRCPPSWGWCCAVSGPSLRPGAPRGSRGIAPGSAIAAPPPPVGPLRLSGGANLVAVLCRSGGGVRLACGGRPSALAGDGPRAATPLRCACPPPPSLSAVQRTGDGGPVLKSGQLSNLGAAANPNPEQIGGWMGYRGTVTDANRSALAYGPQEEQKKGHRPKDRYPHHSNQSPMRLSHTWPHTAGRP